MRWADWVRIRGRLRTNPILIPLAFAALAAALGILLPELDESIESPPRVFGASAAETLLGSIATGMITVTSIAVSMTIATLTFASGSLSPRILRWWALSQTPKIATGIFVFTFIYPLIVLGRVEPADKPDFIPHLSVMLSIPFLVVSAVALLWLVRSMSSQLRTVETLDGITHRGVAVITQIHAEAIDESGELATRRQDDANLQESRSVKNEGRYGVLVEVGIEGLVAEATRADALIELVPSPGSFVARDETLFRVSPAAAPVDDGRLQGLVVY
ncbi:MAG: DUF2254 family protein, partial [Miltoncostaeaceae bacterium]